MSMLQAMQNDINKMKQQNENTHVTNNCRVHIFDERTDGSTTNSQSDIQNIFKLQTNVTCQETLSEEINKYVDLRLKMLETEKENLLKHKQNDIMKVANYQLNVNTNQLEYMTKEGEVYSKRPYSPVKISCIENGMAVDTKSLIDSGADKAVVSLETVRKLNIQIRPTKTRARDAGGSNIKL